MVRLAFLFCALLVACGGSSPTTPRNPLVVIPGTTNRITENPEVRDNTDLFLKIYTKPEDCRTLTGTDEEYALCMPGVDRASGEVRLSFSLQLRDSSDPFPLPLGTDHVRALHNQRHIRADQDHTDFVLVPHKELAARQLFILVIDGSGSMSKTNSAGVSRMGQVKSALLSRGVKDAFFPDDVKTGVVILQFTDGRPVPLTGRLEVLEDKMAYSAAIQGHLRVRNGYTHLYEAIRYATRPLLEEELISRWLESYDAEPTVVALTDGFNNIRADDTCAKNADRLGRLLRHLQEVRRGAGARKPRVYTVGLGRPIRANYAMPTTRSPDLSGRDLCGRYVSRRIDGDLENDGIDNVSLEWIASFGGGSAYVRQGKKKLGEAFEAAAAKRYEWFEVRYRVQPAHLRRSFESTIELVSFATGAASVTIHPSAWLDAPPGVIASDGWSRPASYRRTLSAVLPMMGLVVAMMYLGAAGFNSRRVLSGRTRPPRPPADGGR